MAVADVYDALTSTRSYREAWSHEKALGWMIEQAGSHFDPQVIEAFLRVIDSGFAEHPWLTGKPAGALPKAA